MKLAKGTVITFNETINNQFTEGSKWMVQMESEGEGVNALLIKLKKNGTPTKFSPKNSGPLSESNTKVLMRSNLITIN